MPSYKGNVGNLMQHWTLCELIQRCNRHWSQLRFVDAYAMAPFAIDRTDADPLFDQTKDAAPRCVYQEKWREIAAGRAGYPNSAALVASVWKGTYSMLLCDNDPETADELRAWKVDREAKPNCSGVETWDNDWRSRFASSPLGSEELTFLSFDPDLFKRRGPRNGRHMMSSDLALVRTALEPITTGVLIQLSTYSTNDDNTQDVVKQLVTKEFEPAGIKSMATITVGAQMMSILLGRDVGAIANRVSDLPKHFSGWLAQLESAASGKMPRLRRR